LLHIAVFARTFWELTSKARGSAANGLERSITSSPSLGSPIHPSAQNPSPRFSACLFLALPFNRAPSWSFPDNEIQSLLGKALSRAEEGVTVHDVALCSGLLHVNSTIKSKEKIPDFSPFPAVSHCQKALQQIIYKTGRDTSVREQCRSSVGVQYRMRVDYQPKSNYIKSINKNFNKSCNLAHEHHGRGKKVSLEPVSGHHFPRDACCDMP